MPHCRIHDPCFLSLQAARNRRRLGIKVESKAAFISISLSAQMRSTCGPCCDFHGSHAGFVPPATVSWQTLWQTCRKVYFLQQFRGRRWRQLKNSFRVRIPLLNGTSARKSVAGDTNLARLPQRLPRILWQGT